MAITRETSRHLRSPLRGRPLSHTGTRELNRSLTQDDSKGIQAVKQHPSSIFQTKDRGHLRYFLGLEVARRPDGLVISQRKYCLDLLQDAGYSGCKPTTTSMDANHKLWVDSSDTNFPLQNPEYYRRLGNLNLITQALEAVDCKLKVIPDPTTVHFHLPDNLSVRVHREYDMFISELVNHFPHEKEGIQKFYDECWKVLCDRHFGGVNYPVGGVGGIAKALANGLVNKGSKLLYKANVTNIVLKDGKAVGVSLSDGREFFAKTVISNATRWDTFGKLLKVDDIPQSEKNFQNIYVKAPSFLSIHMGVKATVLPPDTDCHHFILEDLSPKEYREKKELVADEIITRVEKKLFPGLKNSIVLKEVGTPKTHRRYLARDSGTYGPMPRKVPKGLLGMPFNTTEISGLYCVGDSCFPGQGVIAVAFSGVMCAHRTLEDFRVENFGGGGASDEDFGGREMLEVVGNDQRGMGAAVCTLSSQHLEEGQYGTSIGIRRDYQVVLRPQAQVSIEDFPGPSSEMISSNVA
ncbi:hypothetical protein KSP40_PGU009579 [Platanthera guangdongensis]|uniref:Carotenoid isomerase n=1 Tax=Platanthera guangdongensis TaxID=2320717 RepID=A0ABR2LJ06_9ASPA